MCRTEEDAKVVKRGASEISTLCLCSFTKVCTEYFQSMLRFCHEHLVQVHQLPFCKK